MEINRSRSRARYSLKAIASGDMDTCVSKASNTYSIRLGVRHNQLVPEDKAEVEHYSVNLSEAELIKVYQHFMEAKLNMEAEELRRADNFKRPKEHYIRQAKLEGNMLAKGSYPQMPSMDNLPCTNCGGTIEHTTTCVRY